MRYTFVFSMGLPLVAAIVRASVAHAWVTTTTTTSPKSFARLAMSTAASSDVTSSSAAAFQKPPRVVLEELPVVYVYDHCPFCVRVRFALGIKNVKHQLHFLANDDVATPTQLVGKKIAPILEWKSAGICMPESMDIIKYVDSLDKFGPTNILAPATDRTDLAAWQKSVQTVLRELQRPRYVNTGLLPEFQTKDARMAFIQNHPLPPYEKAEWKASLTATQKRDIYHDFMTQDPTARLEFLNEKLVELDAMLVSDSHCSDIPEVNTDTSPHSCLSYDDVDLWSRLRSITILRGVVWPSKLRKYMDQLSEWSDVPLYDAMAQ